MRATNRAPPLQLSDVEATAVKAVSAEPVYTATFGPPHAKTLSGPLTVETNSYQADASPCGGSPGSRVAPTVLPLDITPRLIGNACANASLAGGVKISSVKSPVAPPLPSTATQYEVPDTALKLAE